MYSFKQRLKDTECTNTVSLGQESIKFERRVSQKVSVLNKYSRLL